MLKIALFGAGHLGKIHLKCIQQIPALELVGFYDPNDEQAAEVEKNFGIKRFTDAEILMQLVDIVDIVTPTVFHHNVAMLAIKHGKHFFIEKPLTHTLAEAKSLIQAVKEKNIKVQVGHVERFNPALLALGDMELNPMFVEAHRLATFNPRGTDVSVILDLMIHDLDIVLSMIKSPIKQIHASGVAVVSPTPDIANARIEFENGAVVNLTASRISMKQMRKVRLFQKDAYISLDFLEKQAQIVRMYDDEVKQNVPENGHAFDLETPSGNKIIHVLMPDIEPINAIKEELSAFVESIEQNTTPKVSIEDGYAALKVAYEIIEKIK